MAEYTMSLLQGEDPKKFMEDIAERVAGAAEQDGVMPTIAFSHTAINGAYHYAAIVVGPKVEGKGSFEVVEGDI